MTIQELVTCYARYRKSLGEKFETNNRVLKAFVKYIGADFEADKLTEELSTSFLYHPTNMITAHWFVKHTALRGLFNWAISRELIDVFPLPLEIPRRLDHIPAYIYSQAELNSLFSCEIRSRVFYEECIQTILKLTYVLGLRISETINLKLRDFDLNNSSVTIRASKFFKTRICPYNEAVQKLIEDFFEWRRTKKMPLHDDAALFYNKNGEPIKLDSFQHLFIQIRAKVGLDRVVAGRFKPRLHDLRHTFAVNRLRTWYSEGKNVQTLLPVLSTYLGHKILAYTSVYLTMTPELLKEVNQKFLDYATPKDYMDERE